MRASHLPLACPSPQTAALALGGPHEVPLSGGGRSWYTVFDEEFNLIEVRAGWSPAARASCSIDHREL